MTIAEIVADIRTQFSALSRQVNGQPAVYFDGPAGTQVPRCVIEAMTRYLESNNANHGGLFAASLESDAMLAEAHRAMADFVGTDDPDTIIFGPNMTTLTFALSRALSRTWQKGDEVIVTRLDHDANVAPWTMAAADAGVTVHHVDIHRSDCTLNMDDFAAKLSERTRLVAVGMASNAVGTINPVREIVEMAHRVGALVFVDAVHFAPHALIDVARMNCDFLVCSAYKFFGPHVGLLWGKRELLERLDAYKVRPAADSLPDKWMTGTQNHEGIAGTLAAVDYLAGIGRRVTGDADMNRREGLTAAFAAIQEYESELVWHLIDGLQSMPEFTIWGITDAARRSERVPTISFTHRRKSPEELAANLSERGIFVWHGHYYALSLMESLGLQPQGAVRIGLVHYNTRDEVDRIIRLLSEWRSGETRTGHLKGSQPTSPNLEDSFSRTIRENNWRN